MAKIRSHCKFIDSVKDYKIESFHIDTGSANGGDIFFYKKNDIVSKIVEQFYGETTEEVTEYYLQRDSLIFVFERTTVKSKLYNSKIKKIPFVIENRLYFSNEHFIKGIVSDTSINITNYKKEIDCVVSDLRKYINYLK